VKVVPSARLRSISSTSDGRCKKIDTVDILSFMIISCLKLSRLFSAAFFLASILGKKAYSNPAGYRNLLP
jgi:hypothetical protein